MIRYVCSFEMTSKCLTVMRHTVAQKHNLLSIAIFESSPRIGADCGKPMKMNKQIRTNRVDRFEITPNLCLDKTTDSIFAIIHHHHRPFKAQPQNAFVSPFLTQSSTPADRPPLSLPCITCLPAHNPQAVLNLISDAHIVYYQSDANRQANITIQTTSHHAFFRTGGVCDTDRSRFEPGTRAAHMLCVIIANPEDTDSSTSVMHLHAQHDTHHLHARTTTGPRCRIMDDDGV